MPVFVADEVVTAAKLNLINKPSGAGNLSTRTFTNTSYLDLGSLTGGAGTIADISVSVTTETTALVFVSAVSSNTGGATFLGYKVTGATTVAASDDFGWHSSNTNRTTGTYVKFHTGLTAGVNVFELQARVNAGTGTLLSCQLIVIPV